MNSIYLFSGPCGCGKSTLANAFAKRLVDECGRAQVYVVHGDDFHNGFVQADREPLPSEPFLRWPDVLAFNWECILSVAEKALTRGLDVVIDYVVEDELPRVRALARRHRARLCYVVLTADEEVIRRRLTQRGDIDLIDRALFLKKKLDALPENQGHLFDNSQKSAEEAAQLITEEYELLSE